jgi:hypothetical protein
MMRLLPLLLAAALASSAQDARLLFSKTFPGSTPAYYEIDLDPSGLALYREEPEEENPLKVQLTEAETATIFGLARKLDRLGRKLESGLPVAKMGEKTYAWLEGGNRREQVFNYTTDPDAQALQDWVERIATTAVYYYDLERTIKFDRLGSYNALLKLEAAWDKRRVLAVGIYLPLLNRVAKNSSYMNMARERALKLIELFSNPDAAPESTAP